MSIISSPTRKDFSSDTAFRLWEELGCSEVWSARKGKVNCNDVRVCAGVEDEYKPSWLPEIPEPFASEIAKKTAEDYGYTEDSFSERTGKCGSKGNRITMNDVRRKIMRDRD